MDEDAVQGLRDALKTARLHIAVLGGDPSDMPDEVAERAGADMIQWAVLRMIDEALRAAIPIQENRL